MCGPMTLLPSLLAAELSRPEARSLVLVLFASTLGALLSRLHGRIVLPTVILEIVLGILIGPEVLDVADVNTYITFLSRTSASRCSSFSPGSK